MKDKMKRFTFNPVDYNATIEMVEKQAGSLAMEMTKATTGFVTVYYAEVKVLAFFFWGLGIEQKLREKKN